MQKKTNVGVVYKVKTPNLQFKQMFYSVCKSEKEQVNSGKIVDGQNSEEIFTLCKY